MVLWIRPSFTFTSLCLWRVHSSISQIQCWNSLTFPDSVPGKFPLSCPPLPYIIETCTHAIDSLFSLSFTNILLIIVPATAPYAQEAFKRFFVFFFFNVKLSTFAIKQSVEVKNIKIAIYNQLGGTHQVDLRTTQNIFTRFYLLQVQSSVCVTEALAPCCLRALPHCDGMGGLCHLQLP